MVRAHARQLHLSMCAALGAALSTITVYNQASRSNYSMSYYRSTVHRLTLTTHLIRAVHPYMHHSIQMPSKDYNYSPLDGTLLNEEDSPVLQNPQSESFPGHATSCTSLRRTRIFFIALGIAVTLALVFMAGYEFRRNTYSEERLQEVPQCK